MPDPIPLTPDEEKVWGLLKWRPKSNPIKASELALRVWLAERTVRDIIKCLIEKHGKPIASSTGSPAGYWEITDPAERQEVYEAWRRRGISILARAARLKGITLEEELVAVQLELGLKRRRSGVSEAGKEYTIPPEAD